MILLIKNRQPTDFNVYLVFAGFLFKTSYKFTLLDTTSGILKDIKFIFQFWNLGPSTTYFSFGLDFPMMPHKAENKKSASHHLK